MKKKHTAQSAVVRLRTLVSLLLCSVAVCSVVSGALLALFHPDVPNHPAIAGLTFAERVNYQRAIEEVYWRHRIWSHNRGERPDRKPPLDAVMSPAQLQKKVAGYLRKSHALEDYRQHPLTSEELQAEMDRMAQHTKQPEVLRELFEALGNDPFVIAECLARPVLTERLAADPPVAAGVSAATRSLFAADTAASTENRINPTNLNKATYTLPEIDPCTDDTWAPTTLTNAPTGRYDHTAVWSGTEMIVWGGYTSGDTFLNTGGRYNPSTDSWTATSTTNAPTARRTHTAVWTGTEMIVWGGSPTISTYLNTGGRYNPSSDSWAATSTTNAPTARRYHTAVWTGTEMIVWGGYFQDTSNHYWNTGGRYDPISDSWTATSTTNAPDGRAIHTAIWTGNEMVVWGGSFYDGIIEDLNTGGIYIPGTDSWTATSTTNVPGGRYRHTAVWTGSEMIIWGGTLDDSIFLNTGGRYNPSADNWSAISSDNAPSAREDHTAAWTGTQMIVWGGYDGGYLNTGGRYCAQSGAPSPTPTPTASSTPTATATATATPTLTPRPSPTPRFAPTPRPRSTPLPRP